MILYYYFRIQRLPVIEEASLSPSLFPLFFVISVVVDIAPRGGYIFVSTLYIFPAVQFLGLFHRVNNFPRAQGRKVAGSKARPTPQSEGDKPLSGGWGRRGVRERGQKESGREKASAVFQFSARRTVAGAFRAICLSVHIRVSTRLRLDARKGNVASTVEIYQENEKFFEFEKLEKG